MDIVSVDSSSEKVGNEEKWRWIHSKREHRRMGKFFFAAHGFLFLFIKSENRAMFVDWEKKRIKEK